MQKEHVVRPKGNRLVAKSEVALPGQDEQDLVVDDHALGDVEVRPTAAVCNTNQRIDSFERKRVHPMRRRHLLGSEPPDVQLDSLVVAHFFTPIVRYMAARTSLSGISARASSPSRPSPSSTSRECRWPSRT